MGRGHIHIYIHRQTLQLYERIGLGADSLKIVNINNGNIQDVFKDQDKQENIEKLVFKILRERTRIIDELETSLPGAILGHSAFSQGAAAV